MQQLLEMIYRMFIIFLRYLYKFNYNNLNSIEIQNYESEN